MSFFFCGSDFAACPIQCCMNFWECLPQEVGGYLRSVSGLRELRLRDNKPIKANVCGKWFWLGNNKFLSTPKDAANFGCFCENFIKRACNSSVYAYEKMLAQGFFTLTDGSRVGVCGEKGGDVFKKYTSLCVRVAKGVACAQTFRQSVIVAGPPRSGKTTYLRDLALKLSRDENVVVVDERGEISACHGFDESFCDVFLFADKRYAFETAVRAMSPDWIVCDELSAGELPLLQHAVSSGVRVAASIHANSLAELKTLLGSAVSAFYYAVLLQKDTFSQTVVNLSET